MAVTEIVLFAIFILFIILIYFGLRYPRGREDWPHDFRTSLHYLILGLVFLFMIVLLYLVSTTVNWPAPVEIIKWVIVGIIVALVIFGIFFPRGVKFGGTREE